MWSDKTDEQSGASLRQSLLDIRKTFGVHADRVLHADKNTISLDMDSVDVDVTQWIKGDRPSAEFFDSNFSVDDNFLEGLAVRDPEFQDWLLKERTIIKRRMDDAGLQIDLQPKSSTVTHLYQPDRPQSSAPFETPLRQALSACNIVLMPNRSLGLPVGLMGQQSKLEHLLERSFIEAGDFNVTRFDGDLGFAHQTGQISDGTLAAQITLNQFGSSVQADIVLQEADSGRVIWVGAAHTHLSGAMVLPTGFGHNLISQVLEQTTRYLLDRTNAEAQPHIAHAVSAMFRLSKEDLERSEVILKGLIQQHPTAQAYAWLAFNQTFRVGQRMSFEDAQTIELAQEYAQKALDLDRSNSLVATLVAHVHSYLFGEYDFAAGLFEQALQSNPSQTLAWDLYGMLHAYAGQPEKAVLMADWACELGSDSPYRYYFETTRAIAGNFAGKHRTAIEAGKSALAVRPDFNSLLRVLVSSHAHLGETEQAAHYLEKLRTVEPGFSIRSLKDAGYPGLDTEGGRKFIAGLKKAGVGEV
ncbi:SARP family transcriptional regulator [Algirhabdus cladophorae]|uniref:SARP family transcriptional regulator n=1 Tax=Algirhabdus cladophorae TaxID=3377108 RepID=UPI003B849B16